jgi:hypothetical protein
MVGVIVLASLLSASVETIQLFIVDRTSAQVTARADTNDSRRPHNTIDLNMLSPARTRRFDKRMNERCTKRNESCGNRFGRGPKWKINLRLHIRTGSKVGLS